MLYRDVVYQISACDKFFPRKGHFWTNNKIKACKYKRFTWIINRLDIRFHDILCPQVQQKHIACISVASFHIACKLICSDDLVPEPSDIIKISQCKCTPRDLARMETIIKNKIGIEGKGRENIPVTALSFLKLYDEIVRASEHSEIYQK